MWKSEGNSAVISFVIDESHLRALTPSARHEFLRLMRRDLDSLKERLADIEWYADRGVSYPLSPDQAETLLQTQSRQVQKALHVFVSNSDGEKGIATLEQLVEATGYTDTEMLSRDFGSLTQSLRSVTGESQAWLINWDPGSWEWSESEQRYTSGEYYINGPAVFSLRQAFGEVYEPAEVAR